RAVEWNDMCRGASHWIAGPDDAARRIGIRPLLSGVKTEDEGLYTVQHRYWIATMKLALAAERSGA
ncbi:benzoate 1,2-dioxygenase large subunit, partial [Burkholderia pseudomallei]